MREWIPISTSPKGRLALTAVREFGARPYDEVTVTELAAAAGVTTGALYHHFDSKVGLYAFVRTDVERRLLDRMEGAAAAHTSVQQTGTGAVVSAACAVGFDFAVQQGFSHLLGDPPPPGGQDQLVELLDQLVRPATPPLGRVMAAAWRAAVRAVAEGEAVDRARAALLTLRLDATG